MFRCVYITFGVLASVSTFGTEDEMSGLIEYMRQDAEKCMKEFNTNFEELKKAKMENNFDKIDPCLPACLFKSKHVLDDNGMFDENEAYSIAEKYIKDSDVLEKIKKLGEICSAVNEEEVSDGEKGCERAELILKCFVRNRNQVTR